MGGTLHTADRELRPLKAGSLHYLFSRAILAAFLDAVKVSVHKRLASRRRGSDLRIGVRSFVWDHR